MIHGLLEFVREQWTHGQPFTGSGHSQSQHHLSQPQAVPGRGGLSISSSTAPAAAPHRTLCSASVLLDPSTGDRDVAHEGSQPCPGERHLGPSRLTIKAGPFCAESLPARQHHQSSIRHGTKMGHTPSVRAGYSSTPLPQPHRVPVRAKPGPPLQLVVSDPLSTQTQGGRPRNAALPREKGCCWSAIHSSYQA